MTDAEWLRAAEPWPLLESLRGKASERKLRLLASAFCRRVWRLLSDVHCRKALEVVERFADGAASQQELAAACKKASNATTAADKSAVIAAESPFGVSLAIEAATCAVDAVAFAATDFEQAFLAECAGQVHVIQDIMGNPFRPVSINPVWLAYNSGAVPKLAQNIYEERALDHLPILADALEEAGCTDAAILNHCRGPGPHVLGCWVLDLLLGKQ